MGNRWIEKLVSNSEDGPGTCELYSNAFFPVL